MSRLNDLAVVIPAQRAPSPEHIAQTILDGFNRHYSLFRYSAQRAKVLFESGLWNNIQQLSSERIEDYDIRVRECTTVVSKALRNSYLQPNHTTGDIRLSREQEDFWCQVKASYVRLLNHHKQPECAETFFNSFSCRVLHRTYFNNDFIFVRPAIATEYIGSHRPAYRVYYPRRQGLIPALRQLLADFGLAAPFADLPADVRSEE